MPDNTSSVSFYKKYKSIRSWAIEKKFLELGLETAPKIYSHNIDDPSITMEFIPGVRPHSLGEGWFEVFKKQVKELNEVADLHGWWGFSNGPYYHIEECMKKLAKVRDDVENPDKVRELDEQVHFEVKKLTDLKWNNDNMILGSFDYGSNNTLYHNGEYRLVDFELVSHFELSTFAIRVWQKTHRHYLKMFGSPEDDSKLIEELSQYQVNDAWVEQYQNLKTIWSLQDEMWQLLKGKR